MERGRVMAVLAKVMTKLGLCSGAGRRHRPSCRPHRGGGGGGGEPLAGGHTDDEAAVEAVRPGAEDPRSA